MANMTNSEYQEAKKYIEDHYRYGDGTKGSYVRYLNSIIDSYDDGYECAVSLDTAANNKWTIIGVYINPPTAKVSRPGVVDSKKPRKDDTTDVKRVVGVKPDGAKPDGAKPDGAKPDGADDSENPMLAKLIGELLEKICSIVVGLFISVLLIITGVNGFFSAFGDPDNYIMKYAFMIGMIVALVLSIGILNSSDDESFFINLFIAGLASEVIITIIGSIGVWAEAGTSRMSKAGVVAEVIIGPIMVAFAALLPALIVGLLATVIHTIYSKFQ